MNALNITEVLYMFPLEISLNLVYLREKEREKKKTTKRECYAKFVYTRDKFVNTGANLCKLSLIRNGAQTWSPGWRTCRSQMEYTYMVAYRRPCRRTSLREPFHILETLNMCDFHNSCDYESTGELMKAIKNCIYLRRIEVTS